jgi:hypothetical protein
MTNIQLPQITLDRLLKLKVHEECGVIVPLPNKLFNIEIKDDMISYEKNTPSIEHIRGVWTNEYLESFVEAYSPLQPNEKFYIGETGYYGKGTHSDCFTIETNNLTIKFLGDRIQAASQMTPEQSRFHGVCVNVKMEQYQVAELDSLDYEELIVQHNELYNTNIKPSLDAYVFYLTIRRSK